MSATAQTYFNELADYITTQIKVNEKFTCWLSGESSDFVRINQSKIRQAGHIRQDVFSVDLIVGKKHAEASFRLTEDLETDRRKLLDILQSLRQTNDILPEDPHLLIAEEVNSSENVRSENLATSSNAMDSILSLSEGLDLVGIFAQGELYRAFANSFGQRNWYSSSNFNFDWSVYSHGDKAVKCSYAGVEWNEATLAAKLEDAKKLIPLMNHEPKVIQPGKYRAFLAPAAVNELMSLLCWGGFSRKAQETKQSPLYRLMTGEESLSEKISICENIADGIAPNFGPQGFIKSPTVPLIQKGKFTQALCSARTAKEYGGEHHGASGSESPDALELAAGQLDQTKILEELDTGLYISNLWYLNYSDRMACRMTGMTRFASLWVEDGTVQAPLSVMRFDESMYRALGKNLIDLTNEQEIMLDPGTYFERSSSSSKVPGALIKDMNFAL